MLCESERVLKFGKVFSMGSDKIVRKLFWGMGNTLSVTILVRSLLLYTSSVNLEKNSLLYLLFYSERIFLSLSRGRSPTLRVNHVKILVSFIIIYTAGFTAYFIHLLAGLTASIYLFV